MATSERDSPTVEADAETEVRTARVGADPDGNPVVSIVLSADQLAEYGALTPGERVEYALQGRTLRIE